jgi:hypothetical protein
MTNPAHAGTVYQHASIDPGGIAVRLLVIEFGTLASWNPTGYSLLGWLLTDDQWSLALKAALLISAIILAGWGVRTTLAALRPLGVAAGVVMMAALTWTILEAVPIERRMPVLAWWLPISVGLLATGGVVWAAGMTRLTGHSQKRYVSGKKSRSDYH